MVREHRAAIQGACRKGAARLAGIALSAVCLLGLSALAAHAATRTVDNTVACSDVSGTPYCTIQAAVNASGAGDTVNVGAGSYVEAVYIGVTGLKLQGAQAGVDARGRVPFSPTETVVGDPTGAFQIVADNVTIDGFDVENVNSVLNAGIHTNSGYSGYAIKNNVIRNNVIGLYLNSNGLAQSVVSQNFFQTNNVPGSGNGNGILSDQGLIDALIEFNKFTGHDSSATYLGVVAPVSGITFLSNQFENDASLEVDNGSNLTLQGNTFDASNGVILYVCSTVNITGNVFTGGLHLAGSLRLRGGVSNATITSNEILNGAGAGIYVDDAFGGGSNSAVSAHKNRIIGNGSGVQVVGGTYIGTLDAENNWWGCNAGPGNAGCDSVSGAVDFNPWFILKLAQGDTEVFQGCPVALDADMTFNSDNVQPGGFIPNGVPVTFDSDVGVVTPNPTTLQSGHALATLDTEPNNGTAHPQVTVDNQTVVVTTPIVVHYSLPMIVATTGLQMDTSTRRDVGAILLYAFINDNDTGGAFKTNLLAGLVTLRVHDGNSSFDATVPLLNCVTHGPNVISCRKAGPPKVSALFLRGNGPFVYEARVAVVGLSSAVTGNAPNSLEGLVSVNFNACTNLGTSRHDTIGHCTALRGGRLRCVENF